MKVGKQEIQRASDSVVVEVRTERQGTMRRG
jgi:hypothetical protein